MACDLGQSTLLRPDKADAESKHDLEDPPELKRSELSSIELTDDDWELDVRPPVQTRAPWYWLARKLAQPQPEPDVESASVISFYEIVTLGEDDDAFDHHLDDAPSALGPFAVLQP